MAHQSFGAAPQPFPLCISLPNKIAAQGLCAAKGASYQEAVSGYGALGDDSAFMAIVAQNPCAYAALPVCPGGASSAPVPAAPPVRAAGRPVTPMPVVSPAASFVPVMAPAPVAPAHSSKMPFIVGGIALVAAIGTGVYMMRKN